MGFSSPSEALHQLDGRGRNATPPAAPYGSTSPISPYDGQVQPALSVEKEVAWQNTSSELIEKAHL